MEPTLRDALKLRPLLRSLNIPNGLRLPIIRFYFDIRESEGTRKAANGIRGVARYAKREGWNNTDF